jgi:hypothetical protein
MADSGWKGMEKTGRKEDEYSLNNTGYDLIVGHLHNSIETFLR